MEVGDVRVFSVEQSRPERIYRGVVEVVALDQPGRNVYTDRYLKRGVHVRVISGAHAGEVITLGRSNLGGLYERVKDRFDAEHGETVIEQQATTAAREGTRALLQHVGDAIVALAGHDEVTANARIGGSGRGRSELRLTVAVRDGDTAGLTELLDVLRSAGADAAPAASALGDLI